MNTNNTAIEGTATRQFCKNLETGKIELTFAKSDYMSMTDNEKKLIKSNFLFSSYIGGWVSRSKNNTWSAENVCKQLGAICQPDKGEKLSFSEQVEVQQLKALNRVERFEARANTAEKLSTQAFEQGKRISDFIPMGQPILVGHHSEKRHRRDIEKINNQMGKAVELSNKAEYYSDKAEAAKYTAEGSQYSNPTYLGNRIKEVEAKLRELHRYLSGIGYINKETGNLSTKDNPIEISEVDHSRWTTRVNEENDKLAFYKEKLLQCGIEIHTKESLKELKCTHVKYGVSWYPVKSLNAKSVTVLNWMSIPGNAWKWNVKYTDIKGIKTVEDFYIVLDRDGNENKPQIKY